MHLSLREEDTMTITNKTEKAGNGREKTPPPAVPKEQGLERKRETQPTAAGDWLHPFGLMRRMFRELDRMIGGSPTRVVETYFPQFDVMRRGDTIVVRADLPGMTAGDVNVTLEDGALVVSGERRDDRETSEGDLWHSERSYGRFERAFALPDNVDPESCTARFDDGVLVIELRAPEQVQKGRKIEIETGGKKSSAPATTH
jgi:HSP20 family protein